MRGLGLLLVSGCGAVHHAAPAFDGSAASCDALEHAAPAFFDAPIAFARVDGTAPEPGARALRDGTVYQRVAVTQHGGADVEPPRPTLIAFRFAAADQRTGTYCVAQAHRDEAGTWRTGHYRLTFVPDPGDPAGVVATLGDGSFPIAFAGDAATLIIYVTADDARDVERYQAVAP